MMTSADVKKYAKACGADLVGITPMDRFEGALKRFRKPRPRLGVEVEGRMDAGLVQGLDLVIELDRRGDLAPVAGLGQFPRCLQVFLVVRQGQQYQFDPGIRQVQA